MPLRAAILFQPQDKLMLTTSSGGIGKERLTAFYTHHFIFSNPPDTVMKNVSRTVGVDRVVGTQRPLIACIYLYSLSCRRIYLLHHAHHTSGLAAARRTTNGEEDGDSHDGRHQRPRRPFVPRYVVSICSASLFSSRLVQVALSTYPDPPLRTHLVGPRHRAQASRSAPGHPRGAHSKRPSQTQAASRRRSVCTPARQ